MTRYQFLLSLTLASFLSTSAHAVLGDKPIEMADGCKIVLDAKPKPVGTSLVALKIQTNDPLVELMANGPIDIAETKYDRNPATNFDKQQSAALDLGDKIADMILSPEFRGQEDLMIKTGDYLRTKLGFIPDEMLTGITSILDEELAATRTPKEGAAKNRKPTGNALADMTAVISEYRKDGLNVDTASKFMIKLGMRDQGIMIREKFQTVREAINKILDTFDVELAKMYLRHEQMKDARLTAKLLESYEQISLAVADQVEKRCEEFMANSDLTQDEKNSFMADTMKPLAERKGAMTRNRGSALTAYAGYRLLMANNQNLIGIFTNLRETAKIDLVTNAGMKIIASEQAKQILLATDTLNQLDLLRADTVDTIVKTGIKIMEFPTKMAVPSIEKMAGLMDQLLTQLSAVAESDVRTAGLLNDVSKRVNQKFDQLKAKSNSINLMREEDRQLDTVVQSNVEKLPPPPPSLPAITQGTGK